MKCPFCTAFETKVIDSRLNQLGDSTRRRRECPRCQGRFTTYERVEEILPVVIKKDGRREAFSRQKILDGVQKACEKRSVPIGSLDALLTRMERKIQSFGLKEVPTRTIGQMAMIELHELDKVAYVRFASVYREFKDVEEFMAELTELSDLQTQATATSAGDAVDPQALTFSFAQEDATQPSTPTSLPEKGQAS